MYRTVVTLAALSLTTTALAAEPRDVEVGFGSFFNAGGSFITEGNDVAVPSSGFAGFSPGVGFGLDARYGGFVGLELNLIQSWDSAEGRYSITDLGTGASAEWRYFAKQSALHLPIYLKLAVPSELVRPNLFFGREFVFPKNERIELESGPDGFVDLSAKADPYGLWAFGLGFEFCLPIEGVDIRVPLSFRGSLQPNYPSDPFVRNTYAVDSNNVLTGIEWGTEFQYHAAITLGVWWFFV